MPSSIEGAVLCSVVRSLESKGIPLLRGESSQWQALFCDIGLFREAVSKKVWAIACGDHDFGYLLDCLLLACVLYDMRFDCCLAIWLTDCSQNAASAVSFA